ncbi:putative Aspartyl protease gag polyprotein putative aspartyl protease Retroviral aspartyl protease [Trypanosoma vivax]|uniref:Putative DNA-damage inducible protein DDI1-like protein n=1 Tax=Trypanosoma vivax (strain Y486) TaxID=1055687 RepID=G0U225_TRYVY|nr:putative DNA-damage inducible protein DDI1-like protein [Trypanosoma vivax]KAH8618599.1 putative Aspartyl protease gag polyprotein putative aspartyl protease Retroviral aspartyl protease [Trypanosoma vivax]CCC50328.1 putative DNA-damage inducible protein DDI1-like protein [Trypanosoma vivax Y486]
MVLLKCINTQGTVRLVDVDSKALAEDLFILVEVEFGVPLMQQRLTLADGTVLSSNDTLEAQGVTKDAEVFVSSVLDSTVGQLSQVSSEGTAVRDPTVEQACNRIRELFEANAPAVPSHNVGLLDEMSPEAQSYILEQISRRNVEENFETALAFAPETLINVNMLFVECEINKVKIKALVDTGTQASIISAAAAERCGLMRLVDRRMACILQGIGEQQSLGRIHMVHANVSGLHICMSLTVLEHKNLDLVLGLDTMKRHRMVIDLNVNCLRVGDTLVPLLPDSELPEGALGGSLLRTADPEGSGISGGGAGTTGVLR